MNALPASTGGQTGTPETRQATDAVLERRPAYSCDECPQVSFRTSGRGGPTSLSAEYSVATSAATVGANTSAGVVSGGPAPVVVCVPPASVALSATV